MLDWSANKIRDMNRLYIRLDCALQNKNLCTYYESLGNPLDADARILAKPSLVSISVENFPPFSVQYFPLLKAAECGLYAV